MNEKFLLFLVKEKRLASFFLKTLFILFILFCILVLMGMVITYDFTSSELTGLSVVLGILLVMGSGWWVVARKLKKGQMVVIDAEALKRQKMFRYPSYIAIALLASWGIFVNNFDFFHDRDAALLIFGYTIIIFFTFFAIWFYRKY